MKTLTQKQANQIADQSLGDSLGRATQLVWREFCPDCPWVCDKCFPCMTAQAMIGVYLWNIVAVQAKLN